MRSASLSSVAATKSLSSTRFGLISADAFVERRLQRRAGRVDHGLGAQRLGVPTRRARKNHPARRAARCRWRRRISAARGNDARLVEHASHSARCSGEPGSTKRYCSPVGLFIGREIFPRLDMRRRDQARDVLALDQPLQQFSDLAADRIDRQHVAAQPVRDARYIDTAAAGIALGRRAAQFARRLDARRH